MRYPFICLILLVWLSTPVNGQSLEHVEAYVAERNWSSAASALVRYIEAHPAERERLLDAAQWHYWSGNADAAIALYGRLVREGLRERDARLGAGRIWADRLKPSDVQEWLQPLLGASDADALALMSQVSYWTARPGAALRWARRAVDQQSDHPLAQSILRELRQVARPTLDVGVFRTNDTQPITVSRLRSELRLPLHPAHAVGFLVEAHSIDAEPPDVRTRYSALTYQGTWLGVRTELQWGRFAERDTSGWTGAAALTLRLHPLLHLTPTYERAVYRNTVASLTDFTVFEEFALRVNGSAGAWSYEARAAQTRFPDQNEVMAYHVWALRKTRLPGRVTFHVGAAGSWQDAEKSTFTPVLTSAPRPGQAAEYEGRYVPYFTPQDWLRVDALAQFEIPLTTWFTAHASAAVGVYSRDEAPFVYVVSPAPVPLVGTYTRTSHPATYRVALHARLGAHLTLVGEAERFETAFYTHNSVNIRLVTGLPFSFF